MKKYLTFWKVIGYSFILTIIYGIVLGTTREGSYLLGQSWAVLVVAVVICKYTIWKLIMSICNRMRHKESE